MKNKSENQTETKTETKAAKAKPILNKENTKVLNCIAKYAGLTATQIRKKLRWAFIPTRALGCLRNHKFVLVSETKCYTVSAAGNHALSLTIKPKRAKAVKVESVPAVAVETVIPVETPAPVEVPAVETPAVETAPAVA